MNARCHRILFNRTRGLPMVVAETARAHDTHGKGQAFSPPAAPTRDDWPSRYRRPVALAMLLAFSNQYLVAPAHAQIVAYKAAPAKQRPTVLNASNGVALINIQTPSAAGVSHNLYDQFDVSAQGAILNNSQGNTQTQLGGWVQGNPMLAAGSARVILNEVVTAAPSQLHGHIEVAGSPAQVVIANPAGITCNGCGFINAIRTTLTTGSPLITHGTLNGYRVEGGAIRIEGAGMDTRSASYTDLIARAVQINAGLWAQTLTVSTGAHIADATLTHFTPLAPAPDTTPSFAIDVASLGGMYAGKIKLVGTETGVGVRNAGHIGASAGEVHVTADGRLENIGSISAASDINITTRTAILSTGTLSAGSDLRLSADTLELAGSTHSARKLSFTAHAGHIDLSNSTNHADDTLTAHSAQALIHSGAQSHAKQLELTAHSLDNRLGRIVQTGGGNTAITLTGDLDNREGLLASNARNLSLSSAHLDNADGHIEHAGDGTLAITTGTLTGTHGRIASNGTLDLAAHTLKLDHADTAADTLVLHADSLSHEGGQLVQHGAGTGHIAITHGFDNRQATIIANGSLHIAADTLDNRHAHIATGAQLSLSSQHIINDSGQLAAGQDLTALLSGALTNTFGTIAAGRNLDLSATVLDNRNGTLGAVTGTLSATLAAEADNRSGRLEAAQALSLIASGVDNTDGTLLGGSLELDTQGHALINAGGRLLADVHLDVHSGALDNASGLIHAGGDLSIDTHGHTLTNTHSGLTGGILGQHSVTLTTAALDNTAGFIGAGDTLELLADKVHNTTGRIVSTTSIAGAMRRLDNQAGTIETHGALTITADEHIDNHAGLMRSGQTLELHTASLDNRNTLDTDQGIQGRTLDIAVSTLDNRSGALRADTRLAIASSGTLDNRGGLVSSAEEISVSDPSAATTLAITNTDGTFIAGQQLNITAHQLTGGKLLSLNDLAIGLGGDLDNVDEITANHNATLSAAGTLANHGTLQAGNLLALTAGTLDNRANGKIIAPTLSLASTATHTLTNRGLIDGGQTRIDAVTLQNLGTGRLYGDHLAIAANALLNAAEGADQPVIAARNRLDLAVSTLDNRDGALIFSAGDMAIGGALDASHRATGRAGTVTNASATFEALGELALEATALSNIDIHFLTGVVDSGPIDVQAYQNYGAPYRYTDDQVSTYLAKPNSEQWVLYLSTPTETSNHWYRYDYSLHTSETVVLERQAANIQAGGALRIDAIEVLNDKSHLLAGGDLTIAADILNNIDATGQRIETATGTVTRYWRNKRSSGLPAQGIETSAYAAAPVVETFNLATAIYGGNQLFSGSGFNDAAHTAASVDHVAGGSQPITAALADSSPAPRIVQIAPTAADGAAVATVNAPIHLPGGSLYQPTPTAPYLIETDPRFTNYRQWLSSDYLLQQLAFDPATLQKRLGDGFYEQRLITEQVAELTGRRFLDGYAEDEAQYRALMDAGIAFAQAWQLIPGVALSPEQMAQLTSDIVWLVEREVTLANGSLAKALVPQVYARIREGDLAPSGALIAGRNLELGAATQLLNEGIIAASGRVSVSAGELLNRGGLVTGRELTLEADHGLSHLGGLIHAETHLALRAGGNIVVASEGYHSEAASGTREGLSRLATLYASGPGARLSLEAGGDITLTAARLESGQATLIAEGNIALATASERHTETLSTPRAQHAQTDTQDLGTRIDSDTNLTLIAGGRLALEAASLTAGDTLAAQAGDDVDIRAGNQGHSIDGRLGRASLGVDQTRAVASTLSGEHIVLATSGDLTVTASRLTATGDMTLAAEGDLRLAAATEHHRNDWQKGDGRNFRLSLTTHEQGSTLSAGGDLTLLAGNDLLARAADISSHAGAVVARAGRDLTIEAGQTTTHLDQARHKTKRGLVSSTTQTTRDTRDTTAVVGSTVSGETVTLLANRDMQITGSTVSAAQALTLTAGNDLLLDAAESSDQRHFRKTTTQTQGLGRKAVANTLDTFSVRQTGTTLSAGHIDLSAGNDLTLIATAVAATGDIRFTAGAEIAYLAATQLDESHVTRKTSDNLLGFANLSGLIDNGWQQAKAKREATSTTRTGAVTVIQTPDAVLSQSAGDTTLAGTTIRAGRFTATAGLGANGEGGQANAQIHLLGIKESETFSQTKESGSFMWQSAKGEGHRTETLRLPDIQAYGASTAAPAIGPQGPVGDVPETERASELASLSPTLTAPGGITVGATDLTTTQAEANRATPGHAGNGTPPPTVKLDLKTQAETLAQQPGLAWLGELAQRDDVDWQQIALIHDQWDYKQSGLTQEGAAVIAIVVAILTWGSASSAGAAVAEGAGMTTAAGTAGASTVAASTAGTVLTTTGAAVATATAAGITTLATQASVSLINNKGDIGQTLKDLGSSDSVKQLLTSMLTAGALNAVGGTDWMKQFNGTTITDRLVTQMVNSAVSATVQTAVMGGSYEDTLSTMLLTGGVNATAGWAAGEIGAWYADANTDIAGKYLAHKVAHALLGCAGAAAKGDDCASGAIGGAVGEAFAEMMGHATEGPLTDAQRKQILDLSKLVAVATAAVTGHDVNAAADAAVIAVANNYLDHRKPNAAALSEKEIYERASEECRGGDEASCRTQLELAARSAQRDALLAQACAGGPTRECQGLVAEARARGNVVWGQYGQLVWANSPDADFPLNMATIGPVQQNPAYAGAYHNQQAGSLSEGLLLTGVGGASAYVGSTATLGRLVAGAGLGGGFDAAGQGVKLHMGTQEEYRRMQTVFAMSSGALAFQLAGTPAFGNSLIRNSLIGGTVGASNTTMTNWWYGENGSVRNALLIGGLFGGGGTAVGHIATGQLQKMLPLFVGSKPYNPALPILLQNVKPNPYPGQAGFVLEQGISNIPSFLDSQEGGEK